MHRQLKIICDSLGLFLLSFTLICGLISTKLAWAAPSSESEHSCPEVLQHQVAYADSSTNSTLCEYAGKPILVVNIASGCGFTPQLEGLEALYQKYKEKGLVVIGFPSNSFFQEARNNQEIASFCKLKYGVSFPLTAKTPVKGPNAHPLFNDLASATQAPKWNFFKYLISKDGETIEAFPSNTQPDSIIITTAIEKQFDLKSE